MSAVTLESMRYALLTLTARPGDVDAVLIHERLALFAARAATAYAPNTLRAIRTDISTWQRWCASENVRSLPAQPADLTRFIDARATTHRPASIARTLASLALVHRAAGLPSPTEDSTVRLALRGVRRARGRTQHQAAGLTASILARVERTIAGVTLIDLRDVALLRVARDLLARREELSRLAVADLSWAEDGTALVYVSYSKTDQEGQGHVGFLGADATLALRLWLDRSAIADGPVFRAVHRSALVRPTALAPGDIARVVRRRVASALGAAAAMRYTGHSARIGMAQDLLASNASLAAIMEAGRWKTPAMVERYTRALSAQRNAVAQFHRSASMPTEKARRAP